MLNVSARKYLSILFSIHWFIFWYNNDIICCRNSFKYYYLSSFLVRDVIHVLSSLWKVISFLAVLYQVTACTEIIIDHSRLFICLFFSFSKSGREIIFYFYFCVFKPVVYIWKSLSKELFWYVLWFPAVIALLVSFSGIKLKKKKHT